MARYATEADFTEETVNALQMAVDECCANIIEHAYGGNSGNTIDIDVIIKPDRFTVRIRDDGDAYQTDTYNEPDIFEFARRKKSGGFGVHLMQQLMDRVEYRTRGNCNECSLTKFRPTPSDAENGQSKKPKSSKKKSSKKTKK